MVLEAYLKYIYREVSMLRLAANLSMLFGEYDFLDRFEKAAEVGFEAVEYLFPYDYEADEIKRRLDQFSLAQALFNTPPGDWGSGERGLACIPGREVEFTDGIDKALNYAQALDAQRIHVMAGIKPESVTDNEARACYIKNLRYAAVAAQKIGVNVLVEPINNVDMPGYFVNFQEEGMSLIEEINEPNVRLQFDCYHCQMMRGDVVSTFRKYYQYIDHVQIAGVPGRHEPDVGELNYRYILKAIDSTGYSGFIGCEYKPKAATASGLGWANDYLSSV